MEEIKTLKAALDLICDNMRDSYGFCRYCGKQHPKHTDGCSMDTVTNDLEKLIETKEQQHAKA